MKILVIAANCLKVNSSANLCHISYIKGLIDAGHSVDLLTVNDKGAIIDKTITIPEVDNIFEYNGSLYDRLYKRKNSSALNSAKTSDNQIQKQSSLKAFIRFSFSKIKTFIHNLYGVYETSIVWYNNAKKFRSNIEYDFVISLSFPPTSHLMAIYLKNKKHVKAKRWLQIWEDPWSSDVLIHAIRARKKHKSEEKKLLDNASDILYVSPLTLQYQKSLFPENSSKMRWAPLPTYYQSKTENNDFSELHFGYFGDYNSKVRNIQPFYNVANNNNLIFTICGSTDLQLVSNNNITVFPRLSLAELSVHEDNANVLVFLCNLKGGQIPGKIYQYSASNKFILFILDGTEEEKTILKEYFCKYNRYVFCDNNEESILDAINFIKQNTNKTELYTSIDNFEPKIIIKQILEG